jgi:predicted hydrocarbon binding protein
VNKLYAGADTPEFDFDVSSEDRLVMRYASRRRLCEFAQGLIEGAAAHYREAVTIEQPQCMHKGDPCCEFRITLRSAA